MSRLEYDKKAAGDLSRPGRGGTRSEDTQGEQAPAEAIEQDESGSPEPAAATSTARATEVLEREAEPLQRGETFDSPFGPLPKRSVGAMALMVLVGVVVYLLVWAVLGSIGLLLGWIPAAALGFLAARELGRRAEESERAPVSSRAQGA